MGALDGRDLVFLEQLLLQHKPRTVAEIGCASGLSTSMLQMMTEQYGGSNIRSFDLAEKFYGDPDKYTGYLLDEVPERNKTKVKLFTGHISLDLWRYYEREQIDLCFIDACHLNPWPTIDTLAVLPLMKPGGLIVHHDLTMFRSRVPLYATGPKLIYEFVPDDLMISPDVEKEGGLISGLSTREVVGNVFAIRRPLDIKKLALKLSQLFMIGWDVERRPNVDLVSTEHSDRLEHFLETEYSPWFAKNYLIGKNRYLRSKDRSEEAT
ncbi:class I SAM-dependent methyltransferase [Shimia abyssi]|uniref:Methyltransferase family protein n=1 Tax=Shimia abyssi TaxID=1662395 RepID=A0A2P8F624_9RHOB|nr:class I SAM-dependent methyltransferase [Shimia abyssi]PSL17145.1 methyltransferase family protein [Shimia abyssi]